MIQPRPIFLAITLKPCIFSNSITLDGFQASKMKLSKSQDVFNESEHGFDDLFAIAVKCCPDGYLTRWIASSVWTVWSKHYKTMEHMRYSTPIRISQFTSEAFTGMLKAHGITICMESRGRTLDNIFVERLWCSVKYEDVYLKSYATLRDLLLGLTEYFVFLPHGKNASIAGIQYTGRGVPNSKRRRGQGLWINTVRQKNQSGIKVIMGQPFSCMWNITFLNSMDYCLDKGGPL